MPITYFIFYRSLEIELFACYAAYLSLCSDAASYASLAGGHKPPMIPKEPALSSLKIEDEYM
jgi:hypothetical protein